MISNCMMMYLQSFSISIGNFWDFRCRNSTKACVSRESFQVAFQKQEQKGNHEVIEIDNRGDNAIRNDPPEVRDCIRLPPLVRALKTSAEEKSASFHFPGHNRGHAAPSSLAQLIGTRTFCHDLPELPELDNLFAPEGPILEAQKQAAELFGASKTWFLVGGSTCGIQAAIMATSSPGDTIILPRNCHISAISAMVLSGVVPKYIVPEYCSQWDIAGGITSSQVEAAIKDLETEGKRPAAVLIISPSYHGICSNIYMISELCLRFSIPLIVDEAHGAHFGFHEKLPISALAQGADVVIQSTHKVLCSLTQSSMLHLSSNLIDRDRISQCLQALQSSSPSYLLLASLDAATAQLIDTKETAFNKAIELAFEAKDMINEIPGISLLEASNFPTLPTIDPLRITIGTWQLGLSGFEADDILSRDFGVVCELVGTNSITLAFNLGTRREHVLRLMTGLKFLSTSFSHASSGSKQREMDVTDVSVIGDADMILSPRDAFFAHKRRVKIEESVGEVCGEVVCPYPPGIPVIIPGEVVTERGLKYLLHLKTKGASICGADHTHMSSLLVCDL